MLKLNTKFKRIAVVTAVILIPLIYSFFYLYAFWDPYSKLEDLPVAIVNQDQGSVINGDTKNAGNEIINELKTDKSLKWIVTSQSDASDGLKNRKYYAEIFIPKDFSSNLSTVDKDKKTPGVIIYTANEKRNFLAAQVLNRGMLEFKDKISKNITKEIVSNITLEVKKLPKNLLELVDKMDQATDGSSQLYNGISNLKKKQLEFNNGMLKEKDGIHKLTTGSSKISNGLDTLNKGLSSGSTKYKKLADGSTEFSGKLSEFNTGMTKLNTGVSNLNKGVSDINTGAFKLNSGISSLNSGLSKLNSAVSGLSPKTFSDGISQYTESVKTLTAADKTVSDLLQAYLKAHPEAMNDKNIQSIIAISQKSGGALDKINSASDSIRSGSDTLSGRMNQLTSAIKQLSGGSTLLMQASNQLYSGTAKLKDGSTDLKDGSAKLKDGSTKLVNGYTQINGGIQQALGEMKKAADGAKQLYNGSHDLNSGLNGAYKGINELNLNAGKFVDGENKLQAGAKTLFEGLSDGKTQVGDKIGLLNVNLNKLDGVDSYASEPLKMEDKKLNPVPDYGTAFAPYFMSLSLWVGSLLIFYTIYLDPEIKFKRTSKNSKGYLRFFSYYIIAIVQAIVLGVVIEKGLGLDVKNIPLFYGVCILVSLTFISIMQFLIVHLREVGKFMAILLLILQLTSCGGTFPMELVPKFFNVLYDFMPMTYSVNVFKETISGIDYGYLTRNVIILGVTMVVFLVISFIISKKTGLNIDDDEGLMVNDKLGNDIIA